MDYKDNVWIGGNGGADHQVLKLSRDGTFLLQIGQAGKTGGSNDTKLLGRPTDVAVDPETNEVYVADGYLNAGFGLVIPVHAQDHVSEASRG